ncbi:MAG TPA: hypothetical protein VH417_11605 [Vicinamibacterales bacterium]
MDAVPKWLGHANIITMTATHLNVDADDLRKLNERTLAVTQ